MVKHGQTIPFSPAPSSPLGLKPPSCLLFWPSASHTGSLPHRVHSSRDEKKVLQGEDAGVLHVQHLGLQRLRLVRAVSLGPDVAMVPHLHNTSYDTYVVLRNMGLHQWCMILDFIRSGGNTDEDAWEEKKDNHIQW